MGSIDFEKGHGIIVEGTTRYARLTNRSGMDKLSEAYSTELLLTQKSIDALKALKIWDFVQARTNTGDLKYPQENVIRVKSTQLPRAYHRDQTPFDDLIGDGSMIRASIYIKKYDYKGKKGLTSYINSFVVMDLKEYQSADDDSLFADLPEASPEALASVGAESVGDGGGVKSAPVLDDDLPF
jgi:hypothetical protein